jgi:hypothetical protein
MTDPSLRTNQSTSQPTDQLTNQLNQALCHCLACRKIGAGSTTFTLAIPSPNFHFTYPSSSGSAHKNFTITHESGIHLKTHFCGECGTFVSKEGVGENEFPGLMIVNAGTVDGDGVFEKMGPPQAELWVKHRVGWEGERQGVMQCAGFPEGL